MTETGQRAPEGWTGVSREAFVLICDGFLLTKSCPFSLDSLSSMGNKRTPPKLKSEVLKRDKGSLTSPKGCSQSSLCVHCLNPITFLLFFLPFKI